MPLRRPSALVAGLTASVVASLVAALGGTAPAHAVPTDGASGSGDTYFPQDGNGGLDVTHYDVHDRYAVHRQTLRGWTDVTATATQDLSSFDLDLALTPDAVFVDGARASYAKPSVHELRITPAAPITAGSSFVVRVRYHGTPKKVGSGGERPFFSYDGEAMATNEPHVAPWWFPSNDHPSDKATYDISVAVATPFKAISNGRLVARTTSGAWRTFHWRMAQPMASYLAFFAAGRFRVERGTSHGRPWYDAVSQWYRRSEQVAALRLLRRTPGYVSWLETQYGPYPFDSTGGLITSIYTGFALENQSRPTYPFLGTGREARITLVHELAHQWFGDKVSVQRWRDIWLNEGFASWTEWRFLETHGGERAQHRLLREYAARPADRAFWRLVIANPGPKRLFNAPVYDRGAMALQALRHRIGTTAFLSLLRTWTEQHAYGNATVEQFEALAEQVSGQDLDGFFTAWLHTGTKPARTVANGLR